jgi:hypothetical protein
MTSSNWVDLPPDPILQNFRNLYKSVLICASNVVVVRGVFDDVCRILAGVCAGAQPAGHSGDALHRNVGGMDALGGGTCDTPLVAYRCGLDPTLRHGVDLALLHRAQ